LPPWSFESFESKHILLQVLSSYYCCRLVMIDANSTRVRSLQVSMLHTPAISGSLVLI
jgi:hypothetical protein